VNGCEAVLAGKDHSCASPLLLLLLLLLLQMVCAEAGQDLLVQV
jgi:hypothetical protein